MKVIERFARSIDGVQQRNKVISVIFGVIKKFGDDNAGTLVGSLAATAFGSIFPLLLLLFTVLGLVAQQPLGPGKADVLHSTLRPVPDNWHRPPKKYQGPAPQQRRRADGRHRGACCGANSLGLAQNGIFYDGTDPNPPGVKDRPNYLKRLYRSVIFLVVLGIGLIVSTFLAAAVPTVPAAQPSVGL